jgi:hypothetical protein
VTKIWLVTSWIAHEGSYPLAVFSTKPLAVGYVAEQAPNAKVSHYPDHAIYTEDSGATGYAITPMEIDHPEV